MNSNTLPSIGARELREWLRAREKSQEWLALQMATIPIVGRRTRQTSISAWMGTRPIPLWAALSIEALTGIPPKAWLTANVTAIRSGARRTNAQYTRSAGGAR